jgi:hypothetical protein
MSCLHASRRHLRRTIHVVVACAMAAGLWGGFWGDSWSGLASAHAAERTVLAVVTCDSYVDLKKQAGWLGGQIGQPGLAGMLESVLLMATQGRGLAGLDIKRPLGAVVTTDGGDIAIHGFVPVKSLDKLLDSLKAVTGPTEASGETRSLTLPSGIPIDMVERDGWAIVSPRGIEVEAVDPTPLFAPLSENYTLGLELFPHLLPEGLRQQLRMLIEQGAAAAGEQGQQFDARALAAALDGLADTESLALGIAIDSEKERLFIENRTMAVPGSPMAQAMEGSDKGQSTIPMPPVADGKRPAVSAHLVQAVPEASRREVLNLLDVALPATSVDPLTKTLAVLLREALSSVLATGGIDGAVTIDTDDLGGKNDGKPLPAVTAGVRVKDGAALENRVKQSFGGLKGGQQPLPPGVNVFFDSGKVGATNLHTISVDLTGTEAAKRLGKSLDLTLAITPDFAFLMAGGDPRQRLASLLGPNGKADSQSKPIAGVDISMPRVLAYAADQGVLPPEAATQTDDDDTDVAKQNGTVQLLIRPIERGVATRLSADGAAIRSAAARTGAGPDGPPPPGLPLPNGFPIPAPAR